MCCASERKLIVTLTSGMGSISDNPQVARSPISSKAAVNMVLRSLAIDLAAREVTVDGTPVSLTAREFDLLAFMATRPGLVFSRDELLTRATGRALDP